MSARSLALSSRIPPGLAHAGLLWPSLAIILVFMVAPICIMFTYSFLVAAPYGGVEWTFSGDAYTQILFERDFLDDSLTFTPDYLIIVARSVFQAAVATALCLLISVPTAYYIATRSDRAKNIWLFLVTIPYWVNLLIRTIALLFVLRGDGPVPARPCLILAWSASPAAQL